MNKVKKGKSNYLKSTKLHEETCLKLIEVLIKLY